MSRRTSVKGSISAVNVNRMKALLSRVILFCELARMLVLAYVSALRFFLFFPNLFSSLFRGFFSARFRCGLLFPLVLLLSFFCGWLLLLSGVLLLPLLLQLLP